VLCASVLFGILIAGLWPFHAPKNQVSWFSGGNGILLGDYGSLLSEGAFKQSNTNEGASIEIWLEPSVIDDAGTILSFYSPDHDSISFALRQSLDDVALVRKSPRDRRRTRTSRIYGQHVFRDGQPVFLTISSGEQGTAIYVNGSLARLSSDFRFSNTDLTGQLVVGNSAVTTDTWSGQLKGLAIYDRQLSAIKVAEKYQGWAGIGHPSLSVSDGTVALYLFDEDTGNTVHNLVDSTTDLVIPQRFFVLHEPFLEQPWNEYFAGWSYWKDVGVNIVGFIPLGFLFYAYFALLRRLEHSAAVTVAFGFAVSLTIEVLQAFLPTRNSGMTDLITNTGGTLLGVICCAWAAKQNWVAQARVSVNSVTEEVRDDAQLAGRL
jgi:hypothetical protein